MNYEYVDSHIEWIGQYPKHWKIDRIKDKTTNVVGGDWGDDPESDKDGENLVVLRVADLENTYFNYDDLTIRKIKDNSFKSRNITDRCLIIEKSGGGEKQLVGRVGMPKGIDFKAVCSNFMAKIEFDNTVDVPFMNYVFYSLYNNNQNFSFVQQTTGIQNLNVGYYLTTKVLLPPKNEQKFLSEYLDKACEKIDNTIKIKEQQIEKIISNKRAIINEVVQFGITKTKKQNLDFEYLPQIKDGWNFDRFKDVARLRDKKTDEKSEINDYLELEDIEQGTGKLLSVRNTMEVESKTTLFYKGDVLFGKLRPYLEKYHYVQFDGKCTGEILAFEPYKITGEYLKYILGSEWFMKYVNSMSYGAKMPRVNWKTQLAKINLPLPTEDEQKEIVSYLNNIVEKTENLTQVLESQIQTLKEYRKSLIFECVTGKKQIYKGEI